MQPTLSQVHAVNVPLTNISVAYIQSQMNFIASRVFPIVPVDKKSDAYYVYTKNDWFRDEAQKRSPSTESSGSGYNLSTATYDCDVFAHHKDISDQIRANSDAALNPDRDATEYVTQVLMLRQEAQWVTDFFATGKWATDVTGGTDFTQWSNYSSSNPVTDVDAGKEQILKVTGRIANTLVLSYPVFRLVIRHPIIRDQVKYTSAMNVNEQILASIFDVERVIVAKAIKATNLEAETAAYDFTHGKHALLCHVAPNPGLLVPSAGYIFSWKGVSGGMGQTVGISRFRMEQLKSDRVEGEVAFDAKVVGSDLGYFFASAVA